MKSMTLNTYDIQSSISVPFNVSINNHKEIEIETTRRAMAEERQEGSRRGIEYLHEEVAVERELRVNDQAEGLHELPGVVRADEHAALVLADDRERHAEQRLRLLEEQHVPHAQRRLRTRIRECTRIRCVLVRVRGLCSNLPSSDHRSDIPSF